MMPQDGMGPNNGHYMHQMVNASTRSRDRNNPNGNASEQAPNEETQAQ